MKDKNDLEASLRQVLVENDQALKEPLLKALIDGGESLRTSGQDIHDKQGWCTARSDADLALLGYPVRQEDLEFPVSPECPYWHAAERVPGGDGLFRFFAGRAWVTIPIRNATPLRTEFLFPVDVHALGAATLTADCHVEEVAPSEPNRRAFILRPDVAVESITIEVACATQQVPAEVHKGSTDKRLLSLALTRPEAIDV